LCIILTKQAFYIENRFWHSQLVHRSQLIADVETVQYLVLLLWHWRAFTMQSKQQVIGICCLLYKLTYSICFSVWSPFYIAHTCLIQEWNWYVIHQICAVSMLRPLCALQIQAHNYKNHSCTKHTGQMHSLHCASGVPKKTTKDHCLIWQRVQELARPFVAHVCNTCGLVTRNYSRFLSCFIYHSMVLHQKHTHFSRSCANPKPCHCSNQNKTIISHKHFRHFLFFS
jgi:hypothetical protein